MFPIHQSVFDKESPRVSPKAKNDLLSTGRWFREESFTDIQIFGSLANPHMFPLYVPSNLLAQEITYQTVMKYAKKIMWPTFPIQCAIFFLDNFRHAM